MGRRKSRKPKDSPECGSCEEGESELDIGYHSAPWQGETCNNGLHDVPMSDNGKQLEKFYYLLPSLYAAIEKESCDDVQELIPSELAAKVTVGNPEKHGEGFKDAFVTYECKTEYPDGCVAGKDTHKVRRRYQDFIWLLGKMAEDEENVGIILPPLPDKNRLSFMDRFTPDFVKKRQIGLERFLNRLTRHPHLHRDKHLKIFLTQPLLGIDHGTATATGAASIPKIEGVSGMAAMVEQITDAVGSVFSKSRPVEERFLVMKNVVTVMESHFDKLSHLYQKLSAANKALSQELMASASSFSKLSSSFGQLEKLIAVSNVETPISNPESDVPALRTIFGDYGQLLEEHSSMLASLSTEIELKMHIPMVELSSYCKSAKHTMRQRDKKHAEWLDINDSLQSTQEELEAISGGGSGTINAEDTSTLQVQEISSTTGKIRKSSATMKLFFSEKIDSLRGVDPITSRSERIKKLEQKLKDLKDSLETSKEQSKRIDDVLEKDFQIFTDLLVEEIKAVFTPDICKVWCSFHRQQLDAWTTFMRDTLQIATPPTEQDL